MATGKQRYGLIYPKKETYEKLRAIISCPRCKEDYWGYITKKGMKKGIVIKSQQWSSSLMEKDSPYIEKHEDTRIYQCNVCGFKWQVKETTVFGCAKLK